MDSLPPRSRSPVTIVADASVVVAALVDSGPDGTWADELLHSDHLGAPHLMPAEVANLLRRAVLADKISDDTAALAHADLLALRVELFPYEPFGKRVGDPQTNVTAHDGRHLALAEQQRAALAPLHAPPRPP